jgi:hypothetical protein
MTASIWNPAGSFSPGESSDYISYIYSRPALNANAKLRTLTNRLDDIPSVFNFFTAAQAADVIAGTLLLDVTAALQAALNTNIPHILPAGGYRQDSGLTITASGGGFIGQGRKSRLAPTFVGGNVITVGDGSAEISDLIFTNFKIWPTVTKTSGYAMHCQKMTDTYFQGVCLGTIDDYVANGSVHRIYDGIYFDRFSQIAWEGGEIVPGQSGVKLRGNSDQSYGAEISFDGGFRITFAGAKSFWLGGACGGVYMGRMDISAGRYGVYVDDTLQAGIPNRELFISPAATLDSCTGWGLNVENNGLSTLEAQGIWVSGCGSAGTGEGGIRIAPSFGVSLSANWGAPRIQNNYYDGMSLNAGIHSICGGFVRSNGLGGPGGNGITLANAAISGFNMGGCIVHSNGNATRGIGVDLSGAPASWSIVGNTFFGNGIKAINETVAPSVARVIRGNAGWVTENNGTATILNGNATIVVNHGLSNTPTHIGFNFAGPQDAAANAYVTPGSITSTQFTITYPAAAGANRDFWWRAVRGQA